MGVSPEHSAYGNAGVVVLPLPYEESVTYEGGTARGPEAIIAASRQVEWYSLARGDEPVFGYGIHTLPPPPFFRRGGGKMAAGEIMDRIARETALHAAAGKFVLGLGGEHSVSLGIARGLAEAAGAFTLVHIDAHADLRDIYDGAPFSHACVARRIAEIPQCEAVLQLGIRSTSPDQMEFARAHRPGSGARPMIQTWFAADMHAGDGWERELERLVDNRRVFVTFDVDGLDPAIVPATGTPEPDGLTWRQLMAAAAAVSRGAGKVVGMDCVELAPRPGLHHAEFTVAKALYEMTTMFVLGS